MNWRKHWAGAEQIGFILIGLFVVGVALYAHHAAALTLPVPSGDEGYFVWQACAFARSHSFVAPEIDPTRPILLLPFVYHAIVGMAFTVFGCSIEVARHVSVAFVLISFGLLALVVRRHAAPVMALLLIGAFFLNSRFVVMANAIRMEPVFLAAICAALLLVQRQRLWLAVAVLSVTPMIHPNGFLFLVPVVGYGLVTGELRRSRPDRAAVVAFVISAVIWLAHGLYVLHYWGGFVHDTAHRLGEAGAVSGKAGLAQIRGWRLVSLAALGLAAGIGIWRRVRVGYMLAFALGAWLYGNLRREEPYWAFADFAYLLLSLAAMELVARVPLASTPAQPRPARGWQAGLVAAGLVAIFLRTGRIDGPNHYTEELNFSGMRVQPPGAYFQANDRRALQTFLKSYAPDRPIVVEVYPWSDAVLMADMNDRRVRFQLPFFDPLFRPASQWIWGYSPTEAPVPDLYIVRVSRYTPPHLQYRSDSIIARALRHPGVEAPTVVYARDSTERWYALRTPGRR